MRIAALLLFFIYSTQATSSSMNVMFYNVENLFDVTHDEGKNDYEFLPLSHPKKEKGCRSLSSSWRVKSCLKKDWTEKKLEQKLAQIKKVVDYAGRPDLLGLVEVENEKVVRRLAKFLGYKGIAVTESLDKRGIDVALLYKKGKLPIKYDRLIEHKIADTRSILEVIFKKKKKTYHFFINHWPSQGSPSERRLEVARQLEKRISKLKKSQLAVVMGDFNSLPHEDPHPYRSTLVNGNKLIDMSSMLPKDALPGTYFYKRKMAWNFFDKIFISQGLKQYAKSFRIVKAPFMLGLHEYTYKKSHFYGSRVVGIPKRYNFKTKDESKLGFSDHFPVMAVFKDL